MNTKMIENIKVVRLVVGVMILFTAIFYGVYEKMDSDMELPDSKLVMCVWLSFFVFFLGLENKLEKKQESIANFLMLFSIMMLMATIFGFIT